MSRPDSVTLAFAGDVTLAAHFADEVGDSLSYPFAGLGWFGDADVTMVNLENAMTTGGTRQPKEFTFRGVAKYAKMLRSAGVDLVTIANNHIYDFGDDGLMDTIELLDSVGIRHVGAGSNMDSARAPVILTVKGIRIGFLGYLDSIRTVNLRFASADSPGPASWDPGDFLKDITGLRPRVDFIVVNVHWGVEKSHTPTPRQIDFAHRAIDAGADIIIGHHPHVLQGVECYRGRTICYSLGNFLFGGNSRNTYPTAVVKVSMAAASPESYDLKVLPIVVRRWQPRLAEGPEAEEILSDIGRYSEMFSGQVAGR